jgi:hypothetical protein
LIRATVVGPVVTLSSGSTLEGVVVWNQRTAGDADGVLIDDIRSVCRDVHAYGCGGAGFRIQMNSCDLSTLEGCAAYESNYGVDFVKGGTDDVLPNMVIVRRCDLTSNKLASIRGHGQVGHATAGNMVVIEDCRIHVGNYPAATKILLEGVSGWDIRDNYMEWPGMDPLATDSMIHIAQASGTGGTRTDNARMIHIHNNYFHGTQIGTGFPSGRGRIVDAGYVEKLVFERNYIKGADGNGANPLILIRNTSKACIYHFDAVHHEDGTVITPGSNALNYVSDASTGGYGSYWDDAGSYKKLRPLNWPS